MEAQLRKLYSVSEILVQCRHDLAVSTGGFATATAALASTEDAHALSKALAKLAKVEEKVEQVHHKQAEADFCHFFELIKDYVALIGAVKDALNERAKAFQVLILHRYCQIAVLPHIYLIKVDCSSTRYLVSKSVDSRFLLKWVTSKKIF